MKYLHNLFLVGEQLSLQDHFLKRIIRNVSMKILNVQCHNPQKSKPFFQVSLTLHFLVDNKFFCRNCWKEI